MEKQAAFSLYGFIVAIGSIFISVITAFVARLVKGYDSQVKELFERTEDLPAVRKEIEWVKNELSECKKDFEKLREEFQKTKNN